MSTAFNNTVQFPLTQEFIDYWSQTAIAPLIQNNHLVLRIRQDDYGKITKGSGVNTERGLTRTYATRQTKYLGFRARVRDNKEDLYLALVELANYTAGANCSLQPIDVIDYHYRHNRLDRDRGYRIRRGVFEGEIAQVTGTVTQGYVGCDGEENISGNRYGTGFSFKFLEIEPEGYF